MTITNESLRNLLLNKMPVLLKAGYVEDSGFIESESLHVFVHRFENMTRCLDACVEDTDGVTTVESPLKVDNFPLKLTRNVACSFFA